jgi:hypothetical protein
MHNGGRFSFDLVTSPIPATTFRFHCEITPAGAGLTDPIQTCTLAIS